MIEIIPAIDIIEGKCVRLTQGDYNEKKVYNENPLEVARQFEDCGLKRLHLIDLDGAKSGHIVNHHILETIATQTNLYIDFGGGVKSDKDIVTAFECGAQQVTGGSIAVKDKTTFINWINRYGTDRIILGADVKQNNKIAVSGWLETTDIELFPFLAGYIAKGIRYIVCTDVSKDGKMSGSSIELYQEICKQYPTANLIASGGVSSIPEIEKLNEIGVYGAIIGKAIYEGTITLHELAAFTQ